MIKYDMLLLKHVTSNPYLPIYTIQLPWCLIYSWHVESSQCLVFLLNLMIVLTFLVCLLVHTSNFEQGNGGKVGVLWDGTRQREKGVLDTAGKGRTTLKVQCWDDVTCVLCNKRYWIDNNDDIVQSVLLCNKIW